MATITGTTSTGATASSQTSIANGQQIAGNFQQFLTLLTTQLKNQSPLDPLDTNQFTQQLVQFASVEQQLKTNDTLSSLLTSTKASATANAAGYVGLRITADGASQALAGGSATWTLTAPRAAPKATVTIKNADGGVVSTKTLSLQSGSQPYAWDGKDASGKVQPDGTYTISVAATDASGQSVSVASDIDGTVSAVDVSGAAPVLTVNGSSVPLASVKTIAYQ